INTVRLPINPSTVLESWWEAYSATIDQAINKNMKVVLAYWEGASSRDGLIDNTTEFWDMWDTVVNQYSEDENVYFEVFNEPHGYSLSQLTSLYNDWLSAYPDVPRGRIILGGIGYSENVTGIGADSRFNDCLLSLHNYAFWKTLSSSAQWEQDWSNGVGSYADRTIVTEYGATMTSGKNYTGSANGDNEIAYIQGSTNFFRKNEIGSIYWPGLRDDDPYSIQTRSGSGTNITLSTTNQSGVDRIRYGWGENTSDTVTESTYYQIVNRNSGNVLDVNNASTENGADVIQWPDNGGHNQHWEIIDVGDGYSQIVNRNSGLNLDVNGASTADGTKVIQWPYNGGYNQHWEIIDNGGGYYRIINRNSGKALDVDGSSTANGAGIIQWSWNGGTNQQWELIQQ
ncbi:MAG: RICIN domain-containing protein, partial [Desulfobacteraceae bacterium]